MLWKSVFRKEDRVRDAYEAAESGEGEYMLKEGLQHA